MPAHKRSRRELGFLVIEDTRNESETAAIEMATAWCESAGYDTTIVVPADIPLITADELHRVLDAAPAEGAVFVPAYDRRGSNCILRRPASIIPLRFGNDSFLPHCEAMQEDRQGTDHPRDARALGSTSTIRTSSNCWCSATVRHRRATSAALVGLRTERRRRLGSGGVKKRSAVTASVNSGELRAIPVLGIRDVFAGDSVADLVVDALALGGLRLHDGDILVVKHKIVSKAEGRKVVLDSVKPSAAAQDSLPRKNQLDARVVELAMREAKRDRPQEAHPDHRDRSTAWFAPTAASMFPMSTAARPRCCCPSIPTARPLTFIDS